MSQPTALSISSGNYTLAAQVFAPKHPPKTAYVLHCATGVPASYYTKFAERVAEQGFAILTYDYRADTDVTASKITMADWGITDQSAALDALIDLYQDTEIRVIGHSLGGPHDRISQKCTPHCVIFGSLLWPSLLAPRTLSSQPDRRDVLVRDGATWHCLYGGGPHTASWNTTPHRKTRVLSMARLVL